MYICIYIYIYIYINLFRHGNVLMFLFYGFHRRHSRGPVAAGNHKTKNKPTTETMTKTFPATTETINKPTTETVKHVG